MIQAALPLMFAGLLQAQDTIPPLPSAMATGTAEVATPVDVGPKQARDAIRLPPSQGGGEATDAAAPADSGSKTESRWFARLGALGALYNSRATISTNGSVIPGATARVTNNGTLAFDIGYDLSDRFAVMLMGGIPPRPSVIGQGSVSSFGTLGSVLYGPIFLTGVYRLPEWRGFRPYAGGGVARAVILRNHDGAVTPLKVHDNWGAALQVGVEYRLNSGLELYVDYKRLWLYVNAEGRLANAPVRARVTLDPDLISAGVKFHFR
jgi:outer membrane protein